MALLLFGASVNDQMEAVMSTAIPGDTDQTHAPDLDADTVPEDTRDARQLARMDLEVLPRHRPCSRPQAQRCE